MRWQVLIVVTWMFASPVAVLAQTLASDESEAVQRYIGELKLGKLQIAMMEREVERTFERPRRLEYASRLAQLYTEKLISPETEYETSLQWQLKAQQLVQIYPELDDPILQTAMFHARYRSVFHDFETWWFGGSSLVQRGVVADSMRQLVRDLLGMTQRMKDRRQQLTAELQLALKDQRAELEAELVKVENLLLHSHYLVGWSSYFRAILEPGNVTEWSMMADEGFRSFLEIQKDKPIVDVEPSWFDFENDWTSRALLGLSLVKQLQSQQQASDYCQMLVARDPDSRMHSLVAVWNLKSLLYRRMFDDARAVAHTMLSDGTAKQEGTYWTTMIKSGVAISKSDQPLGQELIDAGLTALARLRSTRALQSVVDETKIQLDGDGFTERWVSGMLMFAAAESDGNMDTMEQARIRLAQALSTSEKAIPVADVARCKFLLARIRFQDREFELVEATLGRISDVLKFHDPVLAEQAMWYRAQALIELSRSDPRRVSQAFSVLDLFIRRFPNSDSARRVPFEKLKLRALTLPDVQAVKQYERVEPGSPYFDDARYELTQRVYRSWVKEQNEQASRLLLDKLLEYEAAYFLNANAPAVKKFRLRLLVVDALLRNGEPSIEDASKLLRSLAEFGERYRETQEELFTELRSLEFRISQRTDSELAAEQARWLVENAIGSSQGKAALVFLAEEHARKMELNPDDQELIEEAIATYRLAVELFGENPQAIRTSQNARVAVTRLAELYALRNDHLKAGRLYSNLLNAFPKHIKYLQGLARIKMQTKDYTAALPMWRKLALGTEAGTLEWYEAKLQLSVCVSQESPAEALRLLNQTIHLSPQMPEPWSQRYRELQSNLSAQGEQ